MKIIHLNKTKERIIGSLRLGAEVFTKIETLSKKHKVSKQEIIRYILEVCIDDVNIIG